MKKNDKKIRSAYATLTGIRRAVPILLFALSIFFALCFIAPGGVGLGKYIASFFKGLFSIGGFFIPPLLAIHAIFYAQDYQKKSGFARMIFSVILLFCFSAFLHAIKALNTELAFAPLEFYRAGKELSGGGFFGGILGYVLIKLFGPVGLIIVAALFFALYITYFFANGKSTLAKILLFILDRISDFANKFSKKKKAERLEKKKRAEARRIEAKAPKISAKHSDLYEDEFFSVNNGLSDLRIEELGISEKRDPKEMELFPKLQDKVLKEMTDESEMKLEKEEASKSAPIENIVIPESKPDIPREFSDSADSIFTKEFDPFDFNQNAALAEKQASVAKKTAPTISEYVEAKKSFTEKEINEARLRDFEARREAFLKAEARKREIAEEEEKKRKLSEILREPEPERATYTSYAESYAAKTLPNEDSADEIFEVEVNPKEDVPYTIKDNTLFEEADTDAESSFATLPDEEEETLKIERENVFDSFASNEDEEEEYEEDEDGFEVSFGEEEEEEEPDFDEPIPEELRNPDVIAYRERFAFLREEEKPMPEANVITDSESLIEDIPEEYLEKEKTGEDAA